MTMSKSAHNHELGDFDLRDDIDEIIVPSAQTSKRHCHLPAEPEGTETACKHLTRVNHINRKSISCYPDGHLKWCSPCLKEWGVIE